MGWGRMDDGFDDHPKVIALLDEDDLAAAGMAIGVWTLCFTWAHRNTRKRGKVPGLIPAGLPRRFLGPDAKAGVVLLVRHGLWDEVDGGGWMIHDFEDYLPSEETSAARSAAGKKGAAKRWGPQGGTTGEGNSGGPGGPDDGPELQPDGKLLSEDGNEPGACHDVAIGPIANDGSRAPARRDPTPIPTPKPVPKELSPTASADAPAAQAEFAGMPEPPAPPVKPNDVVATFIDAFKERTGKKPTTGIINRIARDAKRLLVDEGVDGDQLLRAAQMCGSNGWGSLDGVLSRIVTDDADRLAAAEAEAAGPPRRAIELRDKQPRQQSPHVQRARQALALADELDAEEAAKTQYAANGAA